MSFIHTLAKIDEEQIAFTLLKEAALWLKEKQIDYWQDWINPPQYYKEWIHDGFQKNEIYFVYNNDKIVGMYRLQYNDEKFWGKREDKAGYRIGHQILKEVELKLKIEGIKYLRLDCGSENKQLCSYYEYYGFLKTFKINVNGSIQSLYEKEIK